MRDWIDLCEAAMSPFAQWKRWWANGKTGEVLTVPAGMDHDNYVEEHLDHFLSDQQIEMIDPSGDFYANNDDYLNAIYEEGWQAVLYDGSDKSLMMRFVEGAPPTALVKITRKIASSVQIDALYIDLSDGSDSYRLEGKKLDRFLKTGRLPVGINSK